MYLGISVSLSWCLRASVFLRDLCGQRVSVCVCACVSPCQCLVAGFPWLSAGLVSRCVHACRSAAVVCGVSDCPQPLRFVAVSLSATLCLPPCLSQCVSVPGFSGSVYVSDTLGLPISVPVCHCVCPPMCHHLPRCRRVFYSPPRPQVGVSGPLVPRAAAQPIPPSPCRGPGWAPVCNACPR